METKITDNSNRFGVLSWLAFDTGYLYLTLFYQSFWIGLATDHWHYYAAAILAVLMVLACWAFLPRAKPYKWAIWPILLFAGLFALGILTVLIGQPPLGNELYPLGWEGNIALVIIFAAYAGQLALLVQCLRPRTGKQETKTPML